MSPDFYRKFQCSPFGRAKNWERIETYNSIFTKYKNVVKGDLKNKTILEIGSGDQIYTALFFLAAGADKVLLVEPKINITGEKLSTSLKKFRVFSKQSLVTEEDCNEKLLMFSEMSSIPDLYNSSIDYVFSRLVLEHFDDLSSFFKSTYRLLNDTGMSYNAVDLSDHTYHIFNKLKLTEWIFKKRALFHLRYSDETFEKLNDDKCFMNRQLLPVYFELAEKHNLVIYVPHKNLFKKTRIHNDVLSKFKSRIPEDIFVTYFQMELRKKLGVPEINLPEK